MASALEPVLREAGVRDELCKVGVATAEEKEMLTEEWSRFVGSLMKTLGLGAASKKRVDEEVRWNTQTASSDPTTLWAECR